MYLLTLNNTVYHSNIQPSWNLTLSVFILPPAVHSVHLVLDFTFACEHTVVPTPGGKPLETAFVLLLPRSLFGVILPPALGAVDRHGTVVRVASLQPVVDRP